MFYVNADDVFQNSSFNRSISLKYKSSDNLGDILTILTFVFESFVFLSSIEFTTKAHIYFAGTVCLGNWWSSFLPNLDVRSYRDSFCLEIFVCLF